MLHDLSTWLSPLQAARRLHLSPERVRQLLKEGRLAHVVTPLGRLISPESVDALAETRRRRRSSPDVA
jgi:predicted site-specific integrase-resolvase